MNLLKIRVTLFLLVISTLGFSQKIKVEGFVKDNIGEPLELANVVALDTTTNSLHSYSITAHDGKFRLSVDAGFYMLKISYLGFKTESIPLEAKAGKDVSVDGILLEIDDNMLGGVELTYEMPVVVRGDTIIYNADSFMTGGERKLEDVIENLPGFEINDSGQVEVEGRQVQKVMVEGKEFFDGDSKLAIKNIPASALDKIEVLKNYNDVGQMRNLENDEDNIAINIRLKKGKEQFWFGDLSAGAGLDERNVVNPKVFYYSPEKSLSFIGNINNTGLVPFTRQDYSRFSGGMGSMSRKGGSSISVSSGNLGFLTSENNRAEAIESKMGAFNYNYSPKKTLDLNGFVVLSEAETRTRTESNTIYSQSGAEEDVTQTANEKGQLGLVKFKTKYIPNDYFRMDYNIFYKKSDSKEYNDLISTITGNVSTPKRDIGTRQGEDPYTLTQNLKGYYTLNDKNIFSLGVQHLSQKENPLYNAILENREDIDDAPFSNILPLLDDQDFYNISQNKEVKTNKLDANLDYFYVFNERSNLNLTLGASYTTQDYNSNMYETLDDGTVNNLDQSLEQGFGLVNNVDFVFSDVFLAAHYKIKTGSFTIIPGLSMHQFAIDNKQMNLNEKDNFVKVLPKFNITYQLKSAESLRLSYAMTSSFTDVDKLTLGYVFNNYRSLSRGNIDLENSLSHRYSLSYFSYNMFNFTSMNASLSYSKRENAIKNNSEYIGAVGADVDRVSVPLNMIYPDESVSGNFSYNRKVGKFRARFSGVLSYSTSNSISQRVVNNVPLESRVNSKGLTQSYRLGFSTYFKDAPNLELGYRKSINDYKIKTTNVNGENSTERHTNTDRPYAELEIPFLKNFLFTSEYTYVKYTTNNYSFADANLYYQQEDSDWEFIVSITNLTNNKTINTDRINNTTIRTSDIFILPRYSVFTIKYNL